jgi:hypothetical protein
VPKDGELLRAFDEVTPIMPIVLPLMAALQMFMLAFIAVVMA